MTRLIWYPLMASLLIGVTGHSDLTQIPRDHEQMELNSSQLFPKLEKYTNEAISQAIKQIDEKTALNLVWKLPQVQRKAKEIERLSKGSIKVAAIVYGSPTADDPYYKIRIFEDEPDHNSTVYWFRVLSTNGTIDVLDVIENKYITLEAWREQLKR
ncbi:hypothetical protein I8751_24530 [Nostocaceae cyanobacterium CENA357]|uniref:Uncharacterized protein n=1 Tax=Atlanticothrix silvestris CENA357 TaxID=1725252 RepID=A0A8J7HMB7_9CYAN|nr:hypothetical protein [Atlanticothrix silvestris]MBH8555453.1 hypothetical protein [Atlanticothrix silvestris CENA357]